MGYEDEILACPPPHQKHQTSFSHTLPSSRYGGAFRLCASTLSHDFDPVEVSGAVGMSLPLTPYKGTIPKSSSLVDYRHASHLSHHTRTMHMELADR